MRKAALLVLFAAALAAPAFAQVSIETALSSARVEIGEELRLDFIVMNAGGPVSRPTFPPLDGFTSYSQGHSQEISFVNGKSSSKSIFSYILIPNAEGKKKIGPFEIRIGEKTYAVAPVDVDVLPAGSSPRPAAVRAPITAPSARALPSQGSSVSGQDIFVKAWLDKDEAYVNEPVMLTYTLYTRLSATYKGFEKEAVTTGFWVEDFPPEKTIRRTEQNFNGSRYVVADVRKMALFPTQAGVFTIDPGTLSAVVEVRDEGFDSFFSSNVFGRRSSQFPPTYASQIVQKQIPADKITLIVKALPEAGKPESFTGAVGRYTVESSLDKEEVDAGTPVTYRVRVKGEGNVNTVVPPSFPKLEGFKVYDSATSANVQKDRLVVEGEKIAETVIVPRRAGEYAIPETEFSFFDPRSGKYERVRTKPHALKVSPGEGGDASADAPETAAEPPQPVRKEEVALAGKDIRYIKTASSARTLPGGFGRNPLVWAVFAAIALAGFAVSAAAGRRSSATRDERAFRARDSHRVARRRLRAAADRMKSGKGDEFYAELSKAVYGYFADRLGVAPQSVTADLVDERLGHRAEPALANDLRALFGELGFGQYSSLETDHGHMEDAYRRAEKVLSGYEKALRDGKKGRGPTAAAIALLLLAASPASAAGDGDQLYQTGDFKGAAAAYEAALKDSASPEIHYNLGNAYFRSNQKGKTMVQYLRAARRLPRDPDLRWNLGVLRDAVTDKLEPSGSAAVLSAAAGFYSADEAAAAFGASALLLLLVSFAGWIVPVFGGRTAPLRAFAAFLVVLAAVGNAFKWSHDREPIAVVLRKEVPARYGPSLKETRAFSLHEGAALRVSDRTKEWAYVSLPGGNGGWIPLEAAEIV